MRKHFHLLAQIMGLCVLDPSIARACPWCNLPNHLHESVWGREVTIVIGKVVEVRQEDHQELVKVEVIESLQGGLKAGSSDWYDKNRCQEARLGEQVLAFGRGGNSAAVDGGVLSISLVQEVRWLLEKDFSPENADTAAAYLTAASVFLHDGGAVYFKEHPLETQQALTRRLVEIEPAARTGIHAYEDDQYRFGLVALMKMPSHFSQELAVCILDEFWNLPEQGGDPLAILWTLRKVQTVIAMAYREKDESLKILIHDMLKSVRDQKLSWLCQCLINSDAASANELRRVRSTPDDLRWIKEALVLSAKLNLALWNDAVASSLIKEAKTLGASSADDLLLALEKAMAAHERWTSASHPWQQVTPEDAGWYRESILFDSMAWDKAAPEKSQKTGTILSPVTSVCICLFVSLLVGLFILRQRRFRSAIA